MTVMMMRQLCLYASLHLYKPVCLFVHLSVGWLVGWSVSRLVCQHAASRLVGLLIGRLVSWSDGTPIDWSDGELDIGWAVGRSISHAIDGAIGQLVG